MTNAPIEGNLEEFQEMGRGSPIWSITDGKTKPAYYPLRDGDLLTVFNDASRSTVLWQGEIKLVAIKGARWPSAQEVQDGVKLSDWRKMFDKEKPATLTPKVKPKPLDW